MREFLYEILLDEIYNALSTHHNHTFCLMLNWFQIRSKARPTRSWRNRSPINLHSPLLALGAATMQ